MKETAVAARYAKAFFLVTEKRGETARALDDLKSTVEVLKPGTQGGQFLASPQVRLADKRKVLQQVLGARAGRSLVVFVDLLLRKKRLAELPLIGEAFEALVERAQGIQRATVVSAVPLTPAERDRLHRELERITGKHIRLAADLDPGLLGGATVRIGDRVIDRSVRTLLDSIARQLTEVSV
ncbi:MAG TPA: ATP synthase F1 subunit delta [Candidatus Eisenbacteria bacterium]